MAHITLTYKCGHKGETWEPGRQQDYVLSKAAGETWRGNPRHGDGAPVVEG